MSTRPSDFTFKKGDHVEDLDGNCGVVLGRNVDAEDNYTHWVVKWDAPVGCVPRPGQPGKDVYLITSIRECEIS